MARWLKTKDCEAASTVSAMRGGFTIRIEPSPVALLTCHDELLQQFDGPLLS